MGGTAQEARDTSPRSPVSQRQVHNPVNPVFRFAGLCAEFKIGNGAPDGNVEWGDKNDSCEGDRLSVTAVGLAQEIGVMGDEHSTQNRSAVEQNRILELPSPILLCGHHIDAAPAQFGGDRPRDMNIRLEAEAHLDFFKAWSFWRRAGSERVGSNRLASWSSRSICSSSFARFS